MICCSSRTRSTTPCPSTRARGWCPPTTTRSPRTPGRSASASTSCFAVVTRPRSRASRTMSDRLGTTPSQTVGPFLAIALPWDDGPDMTAADGAVRIVGTLTDGNGDPVPDGLIELWQADPDGRFPHPDDPRGPVTYQGLRPFGRCPTDAAGGFAF